jgi:two-component system response regulator (stage 0 sporulation protein F)
MARILILDDEASVRALLRIVLENSGYEVVEAATADTAVALYEKRPADLVITDIFLPESDGPAKILALAFRHPEMRVIAVSGAASHDTALGIAKLLGARRIMQKPFCIREFLEEVRFQIAGSPQIHQEPAGSLSQSTPMERAHPILYGM